VKDNPAIMDGLGGGEGFLQKQIRVVAGPRMVTSGLVGCVNQRGSSGTHARKLVSCFVSAVVRREGLEIDHPNKRSAQAQAQAQNLFIKTRLVNLTWLIKFSVYFVHLRND